VAVILFEVNGCPGSFSGPSGSKYRARLDSNRGSIPTDAIPVGIGDEHVDELAVRIVETKHPVQAVAADKQFRMPAVKAARQHQHRQATPDW